MTDNEIIKTWEHNASKCKFYENGHDGGLFESTLALINRQRAEIEDLKSQMEWLTGYNGNLLDANTALSGEIEICKSEAIKEFAERLKERRRLNQMSIAIVSKEDIDNLVKEMTEEWE